MTADSEISKTLPFFPAEQGWAPINIFMTQPVLRCRFFDFGF